ncbi:MAG TPA: DoxX family protein [Thermoanaerobaculia bacterium]
MNEGLLLVRLVFGLLMAAHGTQKLFGWFGGYGLTGTGGFFESLGFRPGKLFAFAAGLGEFAGGLLVALGLLGPIGPALVLSVMIVAAITVHWKNGVFAQNNGFEVPLLYAAAVVALAFTGFGAFSLDALLGITASPLIVSIALVAGIGGALGTLSMRNLSAEAQSSAR